LLPQQRSSVASVAPNSNRRKGLTLAAISPGFVVVQLVVTVVNVAVKSIGTARGGGVAGLQWVVNAYTIAFASLILTAGAIGGFVRGFHFPLLISGIAAPIGCSLALLVDSERSSSSAEKQEGRAA
jgi:hypothetical protein